MSFAIQAVNFYGEEYKATFSGNIGHSIFTNNLRDIIMEDARDLTIGQNTFTFNASGNSHLFDFTNNPTTLQKIFVDFLRVKDYIITENTFETNYGSSSALSYFLILKNMGTNAGAEVYDNTFQALNNVLVIGNRFEGLNTHLRIKCNTYLDLHYDWILSAGASIFEYQGAPHDNIWSNGATNNISVSSGANPSFPVHIAKCPYYNVTPADDDISGDIVTVHELQDCPGEAECEPLSCNEDHTGTIPVKLQMEVAFSRWQNTFFLESRSSGKLEIYNLEGREFLSRGLKEGINEVDLNMFAKGIYLIRILNDRGEVYAKKVVVY